MKPFTNIDELNNFQESAKGDFQERYAAVSEIIGAQKLSYSVTIVPPGKKVCPFHNHRINEEMFLILEGEGTLRFGGSEYPVKKHDVIACPPGDQSQAHQIINTSDVELKYFCLSTNEPFDICEYPDSKKVVAWDNSPNKEPLKHRARTSEELDYYDGES